MSTGNKAIPDLPTIPDPVGGSLYITKDNVDYKVDTGGAGGLATLGSDGKLVSNQQFTISSFPFANLTGKPTTLAGYGITDAVATAAFTWTNLAGKPTTFTPSAHTHDAGDIVSGSLASARLTGSYIDFTNIAGSGTLTFAGNGSLPGLLIGDGTAGTPAIRFTSDTNTGIYRMGENNLGISCGAAVRLGVSATGINVVGAVVATGNVTGYSSDARLKLNPTPIATPMHKLEQIGGYTFTWNMTKCEEVGFLPDNVMEHGVLAQEVQKVVPDAVQPSAFDPEYLTVNYARLVPLLIECIKDLQHQIDELKDK
jgi:hypothetical protein